MKALSKKEHIETIKRVFKRKLKERGMDVKSFNEKYLNDAAEEIYKNRDADIMELEPDAPKEKEEE